MSPALEVQFWGTRGSLPSPGPTTARYGGNTSCVEVRAGGQRLIFDAGTGIRELGRQIMGQPRAPLHLFFSHYHWDHIMGFPFFTPIFVPGHEVQIYGETKNGQSVLEILSGQMHPPYFPIKWDMVKATVTGHALVPGAVVTLGDVTVRATRLNHPQGSLCYRVERAGRAVVYATDVEHGSKLDDDFVSFIAGADLLVMDCSYTEDDYPGHEGWGHATWEAAARFAQAGGVEQLAIFHHLPERTDPEVDVIQANAQKVMKGALAAAEGLVLRWDPRS